MGLTPDIGKCTTETGRENPPETPPWRRLKGLDRRADRTQGSEMSDRFLVSKLSI